MILPLPYIKIISAILIIATLTAMILYTRALIAERDNAVAQKAQLEQVVVDQQRNIELLNNHIKEQAVKLVDLETKQTQVVVKKKEVVKRVEKVKTLPTDKEKENELKSIHNSLFD